MGCRAPVVPRIVTTDGGCLCSVTASENRCGLRRVASFLVPQAAEKGGLVMIRGTDKIMATTLPKNSPE